MPIHIIKASVPEDGEVVLPEYPDIWRDDRLLVAHRGDIIESWCYIAATTVLLIFAFACAAAGIVDQNIVGIPATVFFLSLSFFTWIGARNCGGDILRAFRQARDDKRNAEAILSESLATHLRQGSAAGTTGEARDKWASPVGGLH